MVTDKNTLISWFAKGTKPIATQFVAWFNSYWHKEEQIPVSSIEGLQNEFDKKVNSELFDHLNQTVNNLTENVDGWINGLVNGYGTDNNVFLMFKYLAKEYNLIYSFKGTCYSNQSAPSSPTINDVYYYTGLTTATVFGIANVVPDSFLLCTGNGAWRMLHLQYSLQPFTLATIPNTYYNSSGVLTSYIGFTTARIDINETDLLYYSGELKNVAICAVCYFDANNALISRQHVAESGSVSTFVTDEFLIIPSGTKWIGITSVSSTTPVLKKSVLFNKALIGSKLIELSATVNNSLISKTALSLTVQNNTYYNASGVLTSYSGLYTIRYDNASASDLLYYTGNLRNVAISAAEYFDANNALISRQHIAESTSVDHFVTDEQLIIPANTKWIGLTSFGVAPVLKIGTIQTALAQKVVDLESKVQSGWVGKKWLALGDSVTAMNLYTTRVVNKLGLSSCNNMGVGGTVVGTFTVISGTPIDPAVLNSVDLITFCSFINNYRNNFAIGSITDAPTTNGSFYSQLRYTIEYLMTNAPTKVIVGISPLPFADSSYTRAMYAPNGAGLTMYDYNTAMRLTCERYAIPFIDLINRGGINNLNYLNFYNQSVDTIHPVAETGGERMAELIAGDLNRIKL